MTRKRFLLPLVIFAVAGGLLVYTAWGVTLSPLLQAPKSVLIAGYDSDSDKMGAVALTMAGDGTSGGIVAAAYGRISGGGANRPITTGDVDIITGGLTERTLAVTPYLGTDVTALYRQRPGNADALDGLYLPATGLYGYNGTTWDRLNTTASATSLTGTLRVVPHVWSSGTYRRINSPANTGDANNGFDQLSAVVYGINPADAYDQMRVGPSDYDIGAVKINFAFSYKNISTNDNTIVKSGEGILHTLSVNTVGTGSTITVYDNTSAAGVKIATIDSTSAGRTLPPFDLTFSTGLTIATAGTAAADITVTYK